MRTGELSVATSAALNVVISAFARSTRAAAIGSTAVTSGAILGTGGKPGARFRPATVTDVHDHYHGHGSWERFEGRWRNFLNLLTVAGVFGAIIFPLYYVSSSRFGGQPTGAKVLIVCVLWAIVVIVTGGVWHLVGR